MRKWIKKPISVLASAALAASLCAMPTAAYAAGGLSGSVGDGTNWKVPSSQMKNIVWKGEGANQQAYKVVTTWANAWALSGPDYLGVSNSGPLNQQGGGSASSNLANAQNDTLLGIWASTANEVPNAYNWNFFYNLARNANGEDPVDWSAVDVQNGSSPGFDSESGVWAPFKYRPEIIWTSNSLSATQAESAVKLIQEGKYYTDTAVAYKDDAPDVEGVEAGEASEYALPGDASYNPIIMGANNGTPFTFTDSFYELAGYAQQVIDSTANNVTTATVDGKTVGTASDGTELYTITEQSGRFGTSYVADDSGIDWKTANLLPRATRYEASAESAMTAEECALAIEKVTRGAVYYTLSQIDDGKVAKKKVALLTGDPSNGAAEVVVYDTTDQIGGGPTGGKTGVASLAIDQLSSANEVSRTEIGGRQSVSYTTYSVTADDLAGCDFVVDANGSMSENQIKSWVAKNVSSYDLKQRALNDVQYLTNSPAIMNGHNYTAEKLIWGAFNLDFFYPELFPNMELTTWWYDNVYHLNYGNVKTAMQWGLANASLPASTDLASLGKGYSVADLDGKFKIGYDYYQSIKDTAPYNDATLATMAPSAAFDTWAANESSNLMETIKVSGKTSYSANYGKAVTLNAKANIANAKLTYSSNNANIKVDANGKVTASKAGKATITVTASKNRYNDGTMQVAVTFNKIANPMTIAKKTINAKASQLKKKAKTYAINKAKKAQGKVTYSITSAKKGSKSFKSKFSINKNTGKLTVKKGTAKGTYKVTVKAHAAGNANYKAGNKTAVITVKVK